MAYNAGKKSYAVLYWGKYSIFRGLGKKNYYPNQITHTSPQKSTPLLYMLGN